MREKEQGAKEESHCDESGFIPNCDSCPPGSSKALVAMYVTRKIGRNTRVQKMITI
jgi:hypothetical protein